jgi:hypothetical protein
MGGLYFKSGKDACISFKLWNIGQWVLQILLEKILTESIKWMANIEIAFEKFSLLRIFQPRQAAHEN